MTTYPLAHQRSTRRLLRNLRLIALGLLLTVGGPVVAAGPFVETDATTIYTFQGENIGDGFGWVGANLGDLDGDGAADFATTAPFFGGDEARGKVYVYSGKSGKVLHTFVGEPNSRMGYTMSTAGDINQDGTPDYVVGGFGRPGRVVVFSGKDHHILLDLANPLKTPQAFGVSASGAGDVNSDGHADLVVGATRANASETITWTGRIYLYSGLDGKPLWEHLGDTPQGQLGAAVAMIGDVNGDGIPDQAAAAPGAGTHGMGEAYAFSGKDGTILYTMKATQEKASGGTFGTFFISSAGDINNDGVSDIFIGDYAAQRGDAAGTGRAYLFSGKDGAPLHVFEAEHDGDGLGPGRAIPDINGDGIPDVSLAAWTSSAAVKSGGRVYIDSGVDGKVLHTLTGAIAGDSLGVDALWLGDVNGDHNPDYMVTAVGNDFNGKDVGHVYIVSFSQKPAMTMQPILGGCQPIQPR